MRLKADNEQTWLKADKDYSKTGEELGTIESGKRKARRKHET